MKQIKFLLAVLIISCLNSEVFAAFSLSKWKFKNEIIPEKYQGDIAEFEITPEIMINSKPDLSDLRIISESGEEIPFEISIENQITKKIEYPVKMLNLSFVPGTGTFVDFEIEQFPVEHNCIILGIPSKNYTAYVEVKAKENGTWYKLTKDGFIFNHTIPEAGVSASNTTIRYPLTNRRLIRLIIHNSEPIEISSGKIIKDQSIPATVVKYNSTFQKLVETDDYVDYLVDLGTNGCIHNSIKISVDEKNFHRNVELFLFRSTADEKEKKYVQYQGTIYSYNSPQYSCSSTSISYPESNTRYIKLRIYHYDDRPLKVKNVEVYGVARKISFPASTLSQKGKIFLYYGNENAKKPVYDFSQYKKYFEKGSVIKCKLKGQQINEHFKLSLYDRFQSHSRLIIFLLMLLIAILLGAFAVKGMKDIIKNNTKERK